MYPTYLFSSQPFTPGLIPPSTPYLYSPHTPGNTPGALLYFPPQQSSTSTQPVPLSDASSPQNVQNYPQCYQYQPTYLFSTPMVAVPGSFIGAPVEFMGVPSETDFSSDINSNKIERSEQPRDTQERQPVIYREDTRTRETREDLEDLEEIEEVRLGLQRNSLKIRKLKTYLPRVPAKAEKTLKRWFMENYYDPYPNSIERIALAKECGLDMIVINNWFKKARKRQAEIPCRFSIEIERRLLSQMQEQP